MQKLKSGWVLVFSLLLALTAQAEGLPDFTGLIENNSAAVVKINTVARSGGEMGGRNMPPFPYHDLPDLFRDFFEGYRGQPRESRSMGSGFIISADGYVLTNQHVIDRASEITVRLDDRRELPAKVVGEDKKSDLALLKIDAKGLPTVKFGDSDDVKVGEWVVAIGSPFGLDYTASVGIISAIGRSIPSERGTNYVPFLQSDVAINPGNSGGPLFNMRGEVVGINSQIYTRSGGSIGLSFAIPSNLAQEVIGQLKSKGHVERGWLGVYIQEINKELAESLDLDRTMGALIVQVEPDGPADEAGIKAGDVIVAFDGRPIETSGDLPHVVGLVAPGTVVKAEVFREGRKRVIKVEVGTLPADQDSVASSSANGDRLGLTVVELGDDLADQYRLTSGVVVEQVFPGTPAAATGLRRGDIIVQLGYRTIKGVSDYRDVVKEMPSGSPVAIRFFRSGRPVFSTIVID